MGKRSAYESHAKNAAQYGRDSKRPRTNGDYERDSPRPNGVGLVAEVSTARDLQQALCFDQSAQTDFRNGAWFRIFLHTFLANVIRVESL